MTSFPKDVLLVDPIALINTIIFELPLTCEEFSNKNNAMYNEES